MFRRQSVILGWVVFLISMVVYGLTVESTASLWDCAEFIATSYKLEVGHPPGTPFFFLINRIGAMFAGSPENVGYAINMLSALESALTIAFLFWSIAHLARKIIGKTAAELSRNDVWATMIAGAVGALAYAFTDTFWFSAVEAEVYAMSSLFTAVVFWAMLRWDAVESGANSNRWLVFIAYMMGLSIGAHILNLLTIPALVFIYYFKQYPNRTVSDMWKPGVVSILLTGVFYALTPTVVSIGGFVDRVFVNSLGAPVNSGLAFFILLILGGLGYGIYRTHQLKRNTLNTILVSLGMVVIGFSTYGVVLIRSSVNPPMNSNHPDNPYALEQFLNREQYGSRPLMSGQSYASTPVDLVYNSSYYIDQDGKYKPYSYLTSYEFDPKTTSLFPRMYSSQHEEQYSDWVGGIKGKTIKGDYGQTVTVPTFAENLKFFFNYQLNHMYWRYFMWNFVGRQNDIQSEDMTTGNWISGIDFIDRAIVGDQSNLPDSLANNKARNTYYFLPLILGLIGFFFSLQRDGRGFTVITLLFFMTGIAIILYLNQTPSQPRERDYAYAASFYAFCIWIGLGALAVYEALKLWTAKQKISHKTLLITTAVVCSTVPLILLTQNWDDHNRSGRTIARDMGLNYMSSVIPQNAIFLNYGDNDTFPVWYIQEVEGVRTDVRPMNMSYISGDWYIDQMRIKSNQSEPVPITLPQSKYKAQSSSPSFSVLDIPHKDGIAWTAKAVMRVVNSDAAGTKTTNKYGQTVDIVPSKRIALPVDKEAVIRNGIVKPEDYELIEDTVWLNIRKESLGIGEMILLDVLAHNDWNRPIYFTSPSGGNDLGLLTNQYSYLQNDGVAYRFVPIKTANSNENPFGIRTDTDILYDNLMNKFQYGGLKDGAYADEFTRNTINSSRLLETFTTLASKLLEQGDSTKAVEVLDKAILELPMSALGYKSDYMNIAELYIQAGETKKALEILVPYTTETRNLAEYYAELSAKHPQINLEVKYLTHGRELIQLGYIAKDYQLSEVNEILEGTDELLRPVIEYLYYSRQ